MKPFGSTKYEHYHVSLYRVGDSERSFPVVLKTEEYWQAIAMCVTDQTENAYVIYKEDGNGHFTADSVWRNGQRKWQREYED